MVHAQPDQHPFPNPVVASSSYIPADRGLSFLQRDELRPFRLGLELLKPELIQKEEGIAETAQEAWDLIVRRHGAPSAP